MKEIKFRNLTKDEVEVRVGGGGNLLLYKTARVDAQVLDETVGNLNWQKRFYQVKETMVCSIGINVNYDEPNKEPLWVWKDDGGDDDYTMEKVKAELSDATKRAGFAWGIGRSLYYSPKIKLDEQFKGKQFFDVSELEYDSNNHISKLTITTDFGKTIVFQWANGRKVSNNAVRNENNGTQPQENNRAKYITIIQAHEKFYQPQRFKEWLKRMTGSEEYESLSDDKLRIVAQALEKNNK